MTFEQVLAWCRDNGADVRGVYRGKDISISHSRRAPARRLPAIGEIFHWDLKSRRTASSRQRFGPGENGERQAYYRRFQRAP